MIPKKAPNKNDLKDILAAPNKYPREEPGKKGLA